MWHIFSAAALGLPLKLQHKLPVDKSKLVGRVHISYKINYYQAAQRQDVANSQCNSGITIRTVRVEETPPHMWSSYTRSIIQGRWATLLQLYWGTLNAALMCCAGAVGTFNTLKFTFKLLSNNCAEKCSACVQPLLLTSALCMWPSNCWHWADELWTSGLEFSQWQLQITVLQPPVEEIRCMLHNSLPLNEGLLHGGIACSDEVLAEAEFLFQFNK